MATVKANMLEPTKLRAMVRSWLEEDVPSFDFGGAVVGNDYCTAELTIKSPGVLAGVPFFAAVFDALDCEVIWEENAKEGQKFDSRCVLARVQGPTRRVLLGERTALNVLSRCSGVASRAERLCALAREHQWRGIIAGTRKTTPGFRLVEKYGMSVGGADMHRLDLSSMIMLKDNHIESSRSIHEAVTYARMMGGFSVKVEVECSSVNDADQAAGAGAEIVMLDNMDAPTARKSAGEVKRLHPNVLVELSGGLNEFNITPYFCENVDIISLSIAQGYSCVDFSLKIRRK